MHVRLPSAKPIGAAALCSVLTASATDTDTAFRQYVEATRGRRACCP